MSNMAGIMGDLIDSDDDIDPRIRGAMRRERPQYRFDQIPELVQG